MFITGASSYCKSWSSFNAPETSCTPSARPPTQRIGASACSQGLEHCIPGQASDHQRGAWRPPWPLESPGGQMGLWDTPLLAHQSLPLGSAFPSTLFPLSFAVLLLGLGHALAAEESGKWERSRCLFNAWQGSHWLCQRYITMAGAPSWASQFPLRGDSIAFSVGLHFILVWLP